MGRMPADADEKAIVELIDGEVGAVHQGDFDGYAALLAEDATFMPPGGPARSGDELRNWLRAFVEGFAVEWLSFEHGQTAADGDLGYHTYTYRWRVTPRAGGEVIVSQGKGLHVLRRQEGGRWTIVWEIWNATP